MLRRLETLELGDSSAGVVVVVVVVGKDEEEASVDVFSVDPESSDVSDPSREEEAPVSSPVCEESEDTGFVDEEEGVGVDEEATAAGVDEGALVVKALSF